MGAYLILRILGRYLKVTNIIHITYQKFIVAMPFGLATTGYMVIFLTNARVTNACAYCRGSAN